MSSYNIGPEAKKLFDELGLLIADDMPKSVQRELSKLSYIDNELREYRALLAKYERSRDEAKKPREQATYNLLIYEVRSFINVLEHIKEEISE